ncbi:hypothetical protein acdb102_06980 [Acidothermaceae bacterium B102]|nr:hypothetical protein acdb102_06980 [Acidothermaceae bacterium B102]
MFLWLSASAAVAGVSAQAWCARRCRAVWSPALLLISYVAGLIGLEFRTGSLPQALTLVALASSALVLASRGHVENLEDAQWKAADVSERPALKTRQRWLLVRWVILIAVGLAIDVAAGGLS